MMQFVSARGGQGFLFIGLLCAACGGSEPAPNTANDKPAGSAEEGPAISASSEIGGMNEDAVDESFKSSVGSLQRCVDKGATRVEFLGGSVSFFLKIDSQGKVDQA